MKSVIALGLIAMAAAKPVVLSADSFDAKLSGKSGFVKFYAPWCGHCKSIKPAWDQLGGDFASSASVVIGDVDCTVEKDLCSRFGVNGYPTIKYFTGNPEGEAYEGGRDYDSLKAFADSSLGPSCSAAHLDLCKPDELAELNNALALSAEDRAAKIAEGEDAVKAAEATFKKEVEKLQAAYEILQQEKDTAVKTAKAPLRWLRAASASPAAEGKDEL